MGKPIGLYLQPREDHSATSVTPASRAAVASGRLALSPYQDRRVSPLPGRTMTSRVRRGKTLVTERGRRRSPTRSHADVGECPGGDLPAWLRLMTRPAGLTTGGRQARGPMVYLDWYRIAIGVSLGL